MEHLKTDLLIKDLQTRIFPIINTDQLNESVTISKDILLQLLMRLEQYKAVTRWRPILEYVDNKKYDWVLVQGHHLDGGNITLPFVAEYRNGKWQTIDFADVEKEWNIKITDWCPLFSDPEFREYFCGYNGEDITY